MWPCHSVEYSREGGAGGVGEGEGGGEGGSGGGASSNAMKLRVENQDGVRQQGTDVLSMRTMLVGRAGEAIQEMQTPKVAVFCVSHAMRK